MIKISVIIPVYNVEKYLEECLSSIFIQTLKDIEVICVNDGSTDGSLYILDKYRKKHTNMVVYSQENAGSGNARNSGIQFARGEYFMFVDPDDFLAANDVLETLYQTAKDNDADVCGGSCLISRNGILSKKFTERRKQSRVDEEGMVAFKEYQYPYAHQRYIIKRDLMIQNNIYYPEYRRGQDVPFMANILNKASRIYLIKKDVYVQRGGHKVEKFTMKKAEDFVDSLYVVLQLALDNDLEELFSTISMEISLFAQKEWYKLLAEYDAWDKVVKINDLIKKGNIVFGYNRGINCLMDKSTYGEFANEIDGKWKGIEKSIRKQKKIAIYGAGGFGKRVYQYLREKGYNLNYFVVSSIEGNEKAVEGISVVSLDDLCNKEEYLYILCVIDQTEREKIKEQLNKRGCNEIVDFDADIIYCSFDHVLQNKKR